MNNVSKFVALFVTVLSLGLLSGCASYGPVGQPPIVNGTGPMPMFAGAPGAPMMVPPVAQNEAFLNRPLAVCPAILRVEIINVTDSQFLSFQIDGADAVVIGRYGQLPSFIPPHSSVHICLENLEPHTFTGTRYVGRIGQLVPVGQQINFTQTFTIYNDHHRVIVDNGEVRIG